MAFVFTTAIKKMLRLKCRTKVIQGGTSAGKTYGIIPILIDKAVKNKGLEISIVSESFPHLRRGALKDFLKIMRETNRYIDANYNRTIGKYTFANGSYIEFFSADQESRLRGARRDIVYINEANNITFDAYYQLAIRTNLEVWIDYNPTAEFWAHTQVLTDPDAQLLILTYKDNEALSLNIIREIEKAKKKGETNPYWENWWRVYGLGLIGNLQGAVFTDWSQIDGVPKEAKYKGSGMDFGFTNDPSTLIDVYELNGEYIFDEEVYQTGLNNRQLAILCKDIEVGEDKIKRRIVADSAEPKSIDEIYYNGIDIRGAKKGKDSITFGINLIQQGHFRVTARSLNLIKELRNYTWARDRTGKTTNKPIELWNHGIDACRYIVMELKGYVKADIR